jgi:hypothetical protein
LTKKRQFKSKYYEEFKDKQFQLFKQTEEYKKIKAVLLEESEGREGESIDSFLRNSVTDYISTILTE